MCLICKWVDFLEFCGFNLLLCLKSSKGVCILYDFLICGLKTRDQYYCRETVNCNFPLWRLPMPEKRAVASRRKEWKSISANSFLTSPRRLGRSRDWAESIWSETLTAHRCKSRTVTARRCKSRTLKAHRCKSRTPTSRRCKNRTLT